MFRHRTTALLVTAVVAICLSAPAAMATAHRAPTSTPMFGEAILPGDWVTFTCTHGWVMLNGSVYCHNQTVTVPIAGGGAGSGLSNYTLTTGLDLNYEFNTYSSTGDSCLGTYSNCGSSVTTYSSPYWGYCVGGQRCGGTLTQSATQVAFLLQVDHMAESPVPITYLQGFSVQVGGGTPNGALVYYANCPNPNTNGCAGNTGQSFNSSGDWTFTTGGTTTGNWYWGVEDVTTGQYTNWLEISVTQNLVTTINGHTGTVTVPTNTAFTVGATGGTPSGALVYYGNCPRKSTNGCSGVTGQNFGSTGSWSAQMPGVAQGSWYWGVEDSATSVISWVELQITTTLALTINGLTGTVHVSANTPFLVAATGGTPSGALTYYANCASESQKNCAGNTGQSFDSSGAWTMTWPGDTSGTYYWAVWDNSGSVLSNWVKIVVS